MDDLKPLELLLCIYIYICCTFQEGFPILNSTYMYTCVFRFLLGGWLLVRLALSNEYHSISDIIL